jgi:hypothetical protein
MAEGSYQETEPPARSPVSRLDWALVSLLQRVQREVVEPLVERWRAAIWRDEADAERQQGRLRLAHNIDCALKVRRRPGEEPELTAPTMGVLDEQKKQEITSKLDGPSLGLFNSYYYVAIDSYGDPERYYFFPVAPGLTTFLRRDSLNELEKFHEYLDSLELPFVLRSSGRGVYSGALLPGQAGVTPQVCLEARIEKSIKAEMVPLFLNDLAILGKAEDAVQQHLSAIVVPFIQKDRSGGSRCRGAFLLTSSVPDAFAHDVLGHYDKLPELLKGIIQNWVAGPIESLHQVARIESRDARSDFSPPTLRGRLNGEAEAWLSELTPQGAAAVRYEHGGAKGAMRAVNQDSLAMALRSHLCPSPLLAPSCYTKNEIVVPADLRRIADALANLRSTKDGEVFPEILDAVFTEPVCNLASLVGAGIPDGVKLAGIIGHRTEMCVLALCDVNLDPEMRASISRKVDSLCGEIQEARGDGRLLPGERPPIYASLESAHHRATHFRSANDAVNASEDGIYRAVAELLAQDSVIGVLVFEKADLFIPCCHEQAPHGVTVKNRAYESIDRKNPPDEKLCLRVDSALMNPASFWLYEEICHALSARDFPVKKVARGTPYFNPAHFEFVHELLHPISVTLSGEGELDGEFASAMNYLGIPVRQWRDANGQGGIEKKVVIERPLDKCVAKVWKDYLDTILGDAKNNKAIKRAARGTDNNDDGIKILCVSKPTETTWYELLFDYSADVAGSEEPQNGVASITWDKIETLRLEFAGMDVDSLTSVGRPLDLEAVATKARQDGIAQAWRPRSGWKETSPNVAYLERLEHLLAEMRDRSLREREFRVAHEGRSLHQAVDDVVSALNQHEAEIATAEAANLDGSALIAERATSFSRLQKTVNDMLAERAVQEIECRPQEVGTGFLSYLGLGTPRDDILRLADFACGQALRAADWLLRSAGQPGLARDPWADLLAELTKSGSDRWILDDALIIDRSKSDAGIERSNYRILLISKILANLYKNSVLDLARANAERVTGPFTFDHCSPESQRAYRETFLLHFDKTMIETQSSLFGEPDLDKVGTREVLASYLHSSRWDEAGEVSWWGPMPTSPAGLARFQVVLKLPEDFWCGARQ